MLTKEGKEFVYENFKAGKSIRKTFYEMGIPFTDAIERLMPRIVDYLRRVLKTKGNFTRKRHLKNKIENLKSIGYGKIDKLKINI